MEQQGKKGGVQLTWTYDTYAFTDFHENYRSLCSELGKSISLREAGQKITSFVYDFDYCLINKDEKNAVHKTSEELRFRIDNDSNLQEAFKRCDGSRRYMLEYKKYYYGYLLEYLKIMGEFSEKLAPTFMPHTTIQKKLLAFYNNQPFFEQFKVIKREISLSLTNYRIIDFTSTADKILTYYFAYSMFISEKHKFYIERLLSLFLTKLLDEEIIRFLERYDPTYKGCYSPTDWEKFYTLQDGSLEVLLMVNSLMNDSFSKYGVLPKISEKKYVDKTLI
jgi:hypothetical protein